MIIETLKKLFERDLQKVKAEMQAYRHEENIWKVSQEIKNSGGNLCLHLVGNLNAFIGNGLAESEYVRDREFEFAGTGVSRQQLVKDVENTMHVVNKGLDTINENQLSDNFPILIWEYATKMDFTLIHLHSHLNYHLGQLNYHRRLLDK